MQDHMIMLEFSVSMRGLNVPSLEHLTSGTKKRHGSESIGLD